MLGSRHDRIFPQSLRRAAAHRTDAKRMESGCVFAERLTLDRP
ncbi:hypothetical protein BURPSPAST_Y0009 [Burkholderia pseudomallei Pasteur 52237]|uniref:Uncharacterized protein n=1 Tax=Burkholderia pseudomallei 1710a TaxID=320371 RepID=A0A0E1W6R8_BURPE|nr:hypothetical protein BURPSPAST_Y0009 [Burkholderia pseudomallei Pasteur 52237]EET07986.1 hypothetical protein BURPS1710A_0063 [Burkholderia pseudomallei 1710a]